MWCSPILWFLPIVPLLLPSAVCPAVAADHSGHLVPVARALPSPDNAMPTALGVLSKSKRQQIPVQTCPENLGGEMQKCSAGRCGGDSNKAGTCNKILLNGDQRNCGSIGCGVYCKCIPDGDTTRPVQPGDDQIIIKPCPERIGLDKIKCSDCGGEDPKNPGKCTNPLLSGPQANCPPEGCGYICECDNGPGASESAAVSSTAPVATSDSAPATTIENPPRPSSQLIETVVDGNTITATFQVTTLREWKDLRSHTVVTTTTEAEGHETEVAVAIFALGVAWWLAGQSGAAAVLVQPPANSPSEDSKDDESCNPEPKCADDACGGANDLGLCKSGDKQNCPCEEDQCPEERPLCTDQECAATKDGTTCKKDPLEGCDCCPDQVYCEACDGQNGRCSSDNFKGCVCQDMPTISPLSDEPLAADQKEADDVAEQIFKNVYGGDQQKLTPGFPSDGNDNNKNTEDSATPTTSCLSPSGTARLLSPDNVKQLSEHFCNSDLSQDQDATLGGDSLNPANSDLRSGAHFTYTYADGNCSLSCPDTYKQLMQTCQYNSHSFTGSALLADHCGNYTVEVVAAPPKAPADKPSDDPDVGDVPRPEYAAGVCSGQIKQRHGDTIGMEILEFKDNDGVTVPHIDGGGAYRSDITGEDHKLSVGSALPAYLQAWKRKGNEGIEIRYGDQAWSSDKDPWQRDAPVPRVQVHKWMYDQEETFVFSQHRMIDIWWHC